MDIKEIALKICRGMNPYSDLHESEFIYFANKLIESYKAELPKEVGTPVLYAEFAEDGGWLGDASEYVDHLEEPHALFTSDQLAALKAENESLRKDAERYRWLRDATGETPLRPAAFGSEMYPDMRLKLDFPTIVSYDAVGNVTTLDQAIDAAISQGEQ